MSGFMKYLPQYIISHVGQRVDPSEPFGQLLAHPLAAIRARIHPAEGMESDLSFQEPDNEKIVSTYKLRRTKISAMVLASL